MFSDFTWKKIFCSRKQWDCWSPLGPTFPYGPDLRPVSRGLMYQMRFHKFLEKKKYWWESLLVETFGLTFTEKYGLPLPHIYTFTPHLNNHRGYNNLLGEAEVKINI